MSKLTDMPEFIALRRQYFTSTNGDAIPGGWVAKAYATGNAPAAQTGAGRWSRIDCDAADGSANDGSYLITPDAFDLLADDNGMYGEVCFAQKTTTDAWLVGFMDDADHATNQPLQAGSLIPKANFDGAVVWKPLGSKILKTESSKDTTKTTTTTATDQDDLVAAATDLLTVGVLIQPVNPREAEVTYHVNGHQLRATGTEAGQPHIMDKILLATDSSMGFVCGCQTGGTNDSTLEIIYMGAIHLRGDTNVKIDPMVF